MDSAWRCSQLMLVLGTLSLLIPGMNIVATAGVVDTSKNINGSCYEAAVCRGVPPPLDPETLDFGPVVIGQVIVRDVRIRTYNRSFDVLKVAQPDSGVLFVQLKPKTVQNDLFIFRVRAALVPRLIGAFASMITVFTSMGRMQVPVLAQIVPSPFRIHPIENPFVPMGSTFTRDIVIYNPFGSTLRVAQLYLSGGPFDLTTPGNGDKPVSQVASVDKEKWEIPPFKSRSVATLLFDTSRPFRERTFLRIKLNITFLGDIVVPVDMSVVEGCSLYSEGVLDFGFVEMRSDPVALPLQLRLSKPCLTRRIDEIFDTCETPKINSTIIQRTVSEVGGSTTVAMLELITRNSSVTGLVQGELSVKNGLEHLLIPYRAFIAAGSMSISGDTGAWHMPQSISSDSAVGVIHIRNDYPFPVIILDASITGDALCSESEIVDPNFPIYISAGESVAAVAVRYRVTTRVTHYITIGLMTNVGFTELPVHLYTGELRADFSDINLWLHDSMPFDCNQSGTVYFHNTNPATVVVEDAVLDSDCIRIEEMTVCDRNGSCSEETSKMVMTAVGSGSYVRMVVTGTKLKREGVCKSLLRVSTNFQVSLWHLKILVLPGRLELYEYPLTIDDVFPSRFIQRNLTVFNTFDKQIDIRNIFSEEFTRLLMVPPLDGVEISSDMGLVFDTLTFDGRELCKDLPGLCYVGFDLESSNEKYEAWKRPFRMVSHSSVEIDKRMKDRQLAIWNQLSGGEDVFQVNTSLTVTTNQAYRFQLPVSLNFVWPPPLITSDHESGLDFPLLSIGNYTEIDVEVTNPADKTLFVHAYVFRDDKTSSWNRDIFYVKSIVPKGTTEGFYQVDDERLSSRVRLPTPHHGSAAAIVPWEGQFLVRVVFQPQSETCYSATLHIRNNLTVVESIPVRGCGVDPQIKFANDATVPASPYLTMKFTDEEAAYCRYRSVEMVERTKIRRTGRIAVTNTVGAYITVESVTVTEDDRYHPSFALSKRVTPFLLAPNRTRRLHVEFNPDFGMARKTGKVLVHVSDRVEPFVYPITGEIEPAAMRMCGPLFGRSENDWRIRLLLAVHRYGWMFWFVPTVLCGLYIAFIRKWYAARLMSQYVARSEREPPKVEKCLSSSGGRRGGARRRNGRQEDAVKAPDQLEEIQHLVIEMPKEPLPLRELVKKTVPEHLRELYCMAHFAVEPCRYLWHFGLPTPRRYRLFVISELYVSPVRFLLSMLVRLGQGVARVVRWMKRRQQNTASATDEQRYDFPMDASMKGASGTTPVVTDTKTWLWRVANLRTLFWANSMSLPLIKSGSDASEVDRSPRSRSGILSKDLKKATNSPPVATVAPLKRSSVSSKNGVSHHQQQRLLEEPVLTPKSSPISHGSRDSSLCESGESEEGQEDETAGGGGVGGRLSPDDETARSARKLRRRQMHQAKLMAEKAAKLAKTYNKTQRKAEEKRAIDVKTDGVLAENNEKTSVDPSSDSDAERVQRIEAAKRRAKLEADRQAKKMASALSSKTATEQPQRSAGYRSPEIFIPPQIRPTTYPVQTEVIQQAFFKVEQKENGLMFLEMDRDECFQLVKQLKRDHPNLFQLDPKAAVELLHQITRTGRYRVNGDYVDLARKSSVAAYAGANRLKKDNTVAQPVPPGPPRLPASSTPRSSDPRSPEHGWCLSPTNSDNGVADSRLSPMLSYADVASQPSTLAARRSVDIHHQPLQPSSSSSLPLQPAALPTPTEPWKLPYTPAARVSPESSSTYRPEPSRFIWNDPLLSPAAAGTFSFAPDLDDVNMLNDYQRCQLSLADDHGSGSFHRPGRSIFMSSHSIEMVNFLAELEEQNRMTPEENHRVTSPWPDSFMTTTAADVWGDAAEANHGWPSSYRSSGTSAVETTAEPPHSTSWSRPSRQRGSLLLQALQSTSAGSSSSAWPESVWSETTFFSRPYGSPASSASAPLPTSPKPASPQDVPLFGAIGEIVRKKT